LDADHPNTGSFFHAGSHRREQSPEGERLILDRPILGGIQRPLTHTVRIEPADRPTSRFRPSRLVQQPPQQKAAPEPNGGPEQGIPFVMTKEMRQQLQERGYTRDQIRKMRPQEAQDILAQPVKPPTALS
jgi:hypothetical protein